MGTVRSFYANNQTITITLASLADQGTAVSSVIDNSTNKFITADFQLKFRTGSPTNSLGAVGMFIIRSADGGTTFDDAPTNAEAIGNFAAATDNTTFIVSTDSSLSGQLPDFFKIAIKNMSGAAFDATGSNFSLKMLGKTFELV
jgi:hypothetical protein